jgi:Ran GTPase-activating protein (RanGAP) involved in mRNA processing and transport
MLNDADAVTIAHELEHNSTLRHLDISCNRIENLGVTALATALKLNSTLTSLNISSNRFSEPSAVALAGTLQHNTTLTDLNVSCNPIGALGAAAFAETLKYNTTLLALACSRTQIDDADASAIAEGLKHNSSLTSLMIAENKITDAGANKLFQALMPGFTEDGSPTQINTSLTYIGSFGYYLTDLTAEIAFDALNYNGSLQVGLECSRNISLNAIAAVTEASERNRTNTIRKTSYLYDLLLPQLQDLDLETLS